MHGMVRTAYSPYLFWFSEQKGHNSINGIASGLPNKTKIRTYLSMSRVNFEPTNQENKQYIYNQATFPRSPHIAGTMDFLKVNALLNRPPGESTQSNFSPILHHISSIGQHKRGSRYTDLYCILNRHYRRWAQPTNSSVRKVMAAEARNRSQRWKRALRLRQAHAMTDNTAVEIC